MLSACSSGGSQAIPGVGSTTTQAPASHHVNSKLHLVMMREKGQLKSEQSCPYTACFDLPAGAAGSGYVGWCVSSSGNCTSGLLPGRWSWENVICASTYSCTASGSKVFIVKNDKQTGKVKSTWSPRVGNPTDNDLVWKSLRASRTGDPTYFYELMACAKNGPYKGDCTLPASVGLIPATT